MMPTHYTQSRLKKGRFDPNRASSWTVGLLFTALLFCDLGNQAMSQEAKVLPAETSGETLARSLAYAKRDKRLKKSRVAYQSALRAEKAAFEAFQKAVRKHSRLRDQLSQIWYLPEPDETPAITASIVTQQDLLETAKRISRLRQDLDTKRKAVADAFDGYLLNILENPPIHVRRIQISKKMAGDDSHTEVFNAEYRPKDNPASSTLSPAKCKGGAMLEFACQYSYAGDSKRLAPIIERKLFSLDSQLKGFREARLNIARKRLKPLSKEILGLADEYGLYRNIAAWAPMFIDMGEALAGVFLTGGVSTATTLGGVIFKTISPQQARQLALEIPKIIAQPGQKRAKMEVNAYMRHDPHRMLLSLYAAKAAGEYGSDLISGNHPNLYGNSREERWKGDLQGDAIELVTNLTLDATWEAIFDASAGSDDLVIKPDASMKLGLAISTAASVSKIVTKRIFGTLADNAIAKFWQNIIEISFLEKLIDTSIQQDWHSARERNRLRSLLAFAQTQGQRRPKELEISVDKDEQINWDSSFDRLEFHVTFSDAPNATPYLNINGFFSQKAKLEPVGKDRLIWKVSVAPTLPPPGEVTWPLGISFEDTAEPSADIDNDPSTLPIFSFVKGDLHPRWFNVETSAHTHKDLRIKVGPAPSGEWRSSGGAILEIVAVGLGEYGAQWKKVSPRGLEAGFKDGNLAMREATFEKNVLLGDLYLRAIAKLPDGRRVRCVVRGVWDNFKLSLDAKSQTLTGTYLDRRYLMKATKCEEKENTWSSISFQRIPIPSAHPLNQKTFDNLSRQFTPKRPCPFR